MRKYVFFFRCSMVKSENAILDFGMAYLFIGLILMKIEFSEIEFTISIKYFDHISLIIERVACYG